MRRKAKANKPNELLPVILIGLGALLVVSVLIWQVVQAARQGTLTASQPDAQPANNQNIPEPDIQRVSVADSRTALDAQSAVFLDVRDPGSFEAGHIPGSINIPLEELEARAGELDPNQWIITYCT
jgi:3-mercaptopyruvate sulfurtransferase SseA